MNRIKQLIYFFGYKILKIWWFVRRPKTRGAKIFIRYTDTFLFVRHSYGSGRWALPGGGIKAHESPEQAIKREVWEELGIEVKSVTLLSSIKTKHEYKRDCIYIFETEVASDYVNIDTVEIIDVTWMTFENIPSKSLLTKRFIEEYKKYGIRKDT